MSTRITILLCCWLTRNSTSRQSYTCKQCRQLIQTTTELSSFWLNNCSAPIVMKKHSNWPNRSIPPRVHCNKERSSRRHWQNSDVVLKLRNGSANLSHGQSPSVTRK